jgi:hypothetical protein
MSISSIVCKAVAPLNLALWMPPPAVVKAAVKPGGGTKATMEGAPW